MRNRVERAASKLSALEREVLVLSAREGLSNQRIAERLGIETVEVERLLASALIKFDRALRRQEQRPWWRFW
jgi:RNA polymerase sigma factor (sigma-70 family)